jgi:hypothetical protein
VGIDHQRGRFELRPNGTAGSQPAVTLSLPFNARHHCEGGHEGAAFELGPAKCSFERLGPMLDVRHAAPLSGQWASGEGRVSPAEQATRTFMFTDIVGSTKLVAAVGDDAWRHLLQWHDGLATLDIVTEILVAKCLIATPRRMATVGGNQAVSPRHCRRGPNPLKAETGSNREEWVRDV